MNFDFYKYHALGNDYIVIDPQKCHVPLTEKNIQNICHRNFGVGSDGILLGPIHDKTGGIHVRIFNPDGGEAEKSGNGVRIFSRYLFDAGYIKEREFDLQTLGGPVHVEYLDDSAHMIRVDMGRVTFVSAEIPTKFSSPEAVSQKLTAGGKEYTVTCVSIGNPHCVIPVDRATKQEAETVGPLIETHSLFPNKINVQFLEVLDKENIKIEIWERGAGYTLASGTSSCAAASAAHKLGLVGNDVAVHMPGGIIRIHIDEDWRIHMTGSVTSVSYGMFASDLRKQIGL